MENFKATNGQRLQIGFFGKTNSGKSTVVNNIIGQNLSIVSEIKGTTTDVNRKAMELLPIGAVALLDTAGIDDLSDRLGNLRVQSSYKALERCDVAVFVSDNENLSEIEKKFIKELKIPVISVINKIDLGENKENETFLAQNTGAIVKRGDYEKFGFDFKNALIKVLPDDFILNPLILYNILKSNKPVVLVIPIDKEAPKGRIILPQVNVLREMLDYNVTSIVTTDEGLKGALEELKNPPQIVVCDSQAFKKVDEILPKEIPLTSFSILFARLKGDFEEFLKGAEKIDNLSDGNKILILESCSHHPIENDIGRVKIPNLIKKYTNKNLIFEHFSGHDFPNNIENYSLIIHCGACMTNRREVLNRINKAVQKNVPITNYGIAIAKCLNILSRAINPFI